MLVKKVLRITPGCHWSSVAGTAIHGRVCCVVDTSTCSQPRQPLYERTAANAQQSWMMFFSRSL